MSEDEEIIQSYIDDILSRIYTEPASTTSYEQLDIRKDELVHNHPRIGSLFKVHALISGPGNSTDISQKNAQNQYMCWPEEPKIFFWRHMLENNFYSRNPQVAKLEMLVEKLKAHLRIQCTQAQYDVIFERARNFVVRWTRAWLNHWGLIHETQKGIFSRVDQFEPHLSREHAMSLGWPPKIFTLVPLTFVSRLAVNLILIRLQNENLRRKTNEDENSARKRQKTSPVPVQETIARTRIPPKINTSLAAFPAPPISVGEIKRSATVKEERQEFGVRSPGLVSSGRVLTY